MIVDSVGRAVDLNDAYLEMTGRTRDEMIGASTIDLVHADDLPGVIAGLDQLRAGARSVRHRRRHSRADGVWLSIEVCTTVLHDADGTGEDLLLVQTIDQHGLAVDVDLNNELLTRQLFQPAGDAACIHDTNGRIAFGSPSLAALVGWPEGWLIGRCLTDPELDPVDAEGNSVSPADDPALHAIARGGEVSTTLGIRTATGQRIWLAIAAGSVPREALPVRTSLRDISELVEAQAEARRLAAVVEEQLAYRANHDDLTGLTARRIALARLDEAIDAGRPMSIVFVDLDDFKRINDEFGHLAGDDLLIGVADRLTTLAGDNVTVARVGGDEFVVLTDDGAAAEQVAGRIRDAAATTEGLVPGSVRRVSASVGLAHAEPGDTREAVLARADRAMYDAKRSTRPLT